MSTPYNVTITHPATLWEATSMTDYGYQHYDTFITARYAWCENQSCIQNRITRHLQLTEWKSLLVFILLLEKLLPKHNTGDENHDGTKKTFW
jgi:hypothetical protein